MRLKFYWEPGGCTIMACPRCGDWIDADADEHKCGWTLESDEWPEVDEYDEDYDPEPDPQPSEEPPGV